MWRLYLTSIVVMLVIGTTIAQQQQPPVAPTPATTPAATTQLEANPKEETDESQIPPNQLALLQNFFEAYKSGGTCSAFICDKVMITRIYNTVTKWQIKKMAIEEKGTTYLIQVGINDNSLNSEQAWAIRIKGKPNNECINIASIVPIEADGTLLDVDAVMSSLERKYSSSSFGDSSSGSSSGYKPVHVNSYVRSNGTFVHSYNRSLPGRK